MDILTISFDGTDKNMIEIINTHVDKGFRVVSIQNTEDGKFISFVPNDYLTPNQKLDQVLQKIDVMQKAVDDLVFSGGGL